MNESPDGSEIPERGMKFIIEERWNKIINWDSKLSLEIKS